jgi:hypothetical protein
MPTDIRLAMNAAVALNQMADHYWHGFSSIDQARVFGAKETKAFRAELARRHDQWSLVRDVAEAHKHVKLNRADRAVTSAGQAFVVVDGFRKASFEAGQYDGRPSLIIRLDSGKEIHFSEAVEAAMAMWEALLT